MGGQGLGDVGTVRNVAGSFIHALAIDAIGTRERDCVVVKGIPTVWRGVVLCTHVFHGEIATANELLNAERRRRLREGLCDWCMPCLIVQPTPRRRIQCRAHTISPFLHSFLHASTIHARTTTTTTTTTTTAAATTETTEDITTTELISTASDGSDHTSTCSGVGCHNLVVFANYYGGTLTIDIDEDIPELFVGVVSYEAVHVIVTGTFASNVRAIIVTGVNATSSTDGCETAPGIDPPELGTFLYRPAQPTKETRILSNPYGFDLYIVCAYSCSLTINQGGCNTADQIVDFFIQHINANILDGKASVVLYKYVTQEKCWTSDTISLVSSGCCATLAEPSTPTLDDVTTVATEPVTNTASATSIDPPTTTLAELSTITVSATDTSSETETTGECSEAWLTGRGENNLVVFANYFGGPLIIDIDEDVPNLFIGVTSYSAVQIVIYGTYAANVKAVLYAGFGVSRESICEVTVSATSINPASLGHAILDSPAITLNNTYGADDAIICGISCNVNEPQGGCNTADQLADYFVTYFSEAYSLNKEEIPLFKYVTQSRCWPTTSFLLSEIGCCEAP
eukprot:m.150932 g.150932  ORF g.150932 m.150932 type:complete len:571 (-) comp15088_c12_seq10:50-1762(-)